MYNSKETVNIIEKLICVNRVTKTVTGGKKLSFAALVVVGDGKGRVGFAAGKAKEVTDARNKALESAKKAMVKIPLREGRTLHHDCEAKFGSSHVVLRLAPAGTGIIAGGAMRAVFECLGLKDVVSKSVGSNNPYNIISATMKALKSINSPKHVADRREKHISEIVKRRNVIISNNLESSNATNEETNDDSSVDNKDDFLNRIGSRNEEETVATAEDTTKTEE